MTKPWFEQEPEAYEWLRRMLIEKYPTLHARQVGGAVVVKGTLGVSHEGVEIDRYKLELKLPNNYPKSVPTVWETAGRIPRVIDRHVYPANGALCLGVAEELWLALNGDFALNRVLDIPVRNFLIGNSLVEQGQPWPTGDRSHGTAGILEFYGSLLGIKDEWSLLCFLRSVLFEKVKGHWPCPCRSGNILRKCHMDGVRQLHRIPPAIILHTAELLLERVKKEKSAA
jgi:hypothetical protein